MPTHWALHDGLSSHETRSRNVRRPSTGRGRIGAARCGSFKAVDHSRKRKKITPIRWGTPLARADHGLRALPASRSSGMSCGAQQQRWVSPATRTTSFPERTRPGRIRLLLHQFGQIMQREKEYDPSPTCQTLIEKVNRPRTRQTHARAQAHTCVHAEQIRGAFNGGQTARGQSRRRSR